MPSGGENRWPVIRKKQQNRNALSTQFVGTRPRRCEVAHTYGRARIQYPHLVILVALAGFIFGCQNSTSSSNNGPVGSRYDRS